MLAVVSRGILLAFAAALAHSFIDSVRKVASQNRHLSVTSLVCLVAIIDAVLSCTGVALAGGFNDLHFGSPYVFGAAVVSSSALLLYSKGRCPQQLVWQAWL
ncbi:U-box domain-containing protein [Haematococcus lacustris]|uniref:U-box domain-containing protein n=1 Tax=Haematococcus lacustris TaxID=44745 RepID=A0A699ZI29_HAELA|nr:U-box domain-containing protein [Haematococcus lacustris]